LIRRVDSCRGLSAIRSFSPAVFFLPTYAELQYSPAASLIAPAGAISEYLATIGSLSKISRLQHTMPGQFPHAVRRTLAPILLGRFTRPLNGT
jgi:hypothetical protein